MATADNTARDIRKPAKTAGRKPGVKAPTLPDKATALVMLDFFEGNFKKTARSLGLDWKTLRKWKEECDDNTDSPIIPMRRQGGEAVSSMFTNLLEALCVFAIMKASTAEFRDLYYMIGIVNDKVENINKRIESLPNDDGPAFPIARTVTPPPPQSAQPDEKQRAFRKEQERWEGIVKQVIDEAEREGNVITRDEAIGEVVKSKPEAAVYLYTEKKKGTEYSN